MPKILIAEDYEMNRDMLSRRLIRRGYQVVIAIDGRAALESSVEEEPDLILMDMSLPEIDGWEVTRRLKADQRTKRIPVLALTAHAMAGDRQRALSAGCDGYETKPVVLDRLLEKMEAFLEAARAPADVHPCACVTRAPKARNTTPAQEAGNVRSNGPRRVNDAARQEE